eukprot:6200964-Pleurochrysis_carterae.AAC.1
MHVKADERTLECTLLATFQQCTLSTGACRCPPYHRYNFGYLPQRNLASSNLPLATLLANKRPLGAAAVEPVRHPPAFEAMRGTQRLPECSDGGWGYIVWLSAT